jgi:protein ImuB
MPNSVLRRRFGKDMVLRLQQALGQEAEYLFPLKEPVPYSERLDCLEPVKTRTAIEIALNDLLERLCKRLYGEGLGMRSAVLTWYRVDGKNGNISIGTNHASNRTPHLFKLFFHKLDTLRPGWALNCLFWMRLKRSRSAISKVNSGQPKAGQTVKKWPNCSTGRRTDRHDHIQSLPAR